MLGFDTTTAIIEMQVLVYGVSVLAGINASYRMWNVTKKGSIAGLKMIFNTHDVDNVKLQQKLLAPDLTTENSLAIKSPYPRLKNLGILLSFFAGATYGGLSYLGIYDFLHFDLMFLNVGAAVIIIGSTSVAAGSLFSSAWLTNLNSGKLINSSQG